VFVTDLKLTYTNDTQLPDLIPRCLKPNRSYPRILDNTLTRHFSAITVRHMPQSLLLSSSLCFLRLLEFIVTLPISAFVLVSTIQHCSTIQPSCHHVSPPAEVTRLCLNMGIPRSSLSNLAMGLLLFAGSGHHLSHCCASYIFNLCLQCSTIRL
jgi:hypothetical protein